MFNFLKKGKEFNKMAMIMNQMNTVLTDMLLRLENGNVKDDDRDTLFYIAIIGVIGVDDRIDKYDWGMESKIIIPSIDSGFINLMYGYQQINSRMFKASELLGATDIVNEISDKKEAYYQLEKEFPSEFLKNI